MRFDLRNSFPAVTTKKLAWKSVVSELLWFLEGSTDERRLAEIHFGKPREEIVDKKTIWTANANKQGVELGHLNNKTQKELGPVNRKQWSSWGKDVGGEDQIKKIILDLRNNPNSRRHIVSAWNVDKIDEMALPPCHTMFQFHIQNKELSCQLYQRSADMFLGVPFNIASYSLLTLMIAQVCNLEPGDFIHTFGDAHIYTNHFDQIKQQLINMVRFHGIEALQYCIQVIELLIKTTPSFYKAPSYSVHGFVFRATFHFTNLSWSWDGSWS